MDVKDGATRKSAGTFLIATVRDVHDIGKNIVAVVFDATTTRIDWASWLNAEILKGQRTQG